MHYLNQITKLVYWVYSKERHWLTVLIVQLHTLCKILIILYNLKYLVVRDHNKEKLKHKTFWYNFVIKCFLQFWLSRPNIYQFCDQVFPSVLTITPKYLSILWSSVSFSFDYHAQIIYSKKPRISKCSFNNFSIKLKIYLTLGQFLRRKNCWLSRYVILDKLKYE